MTISECVVNFIVISLINIVTSTTKKKKKKYNLRLAGVTLGLYFCGTKLY